MKKLAIAALLALAGVARTDSPAQAAEEKAAGAEPRKHASDDKTDAGGKEKRREKRGSDSAGSAGESKAKGRDPAGGKPCEPVKPCPID